MSRELERRERNDSWIHKICRCIYVTPPCKIQPDERKYKIPMSSNISADNIQFQEQRPIRKEEVKLFQFMCPICLKFFNQILRTKCCKHYICFDCKDSIEQNMNEGRLIKSCWYCRNSELALEDAPFEIDIRHYSDTPFCSNACGFGNSETVQVESTQTGVYNSERVKYNKRLMQEKLFASEKKTVKQQLKF